MANSGAICTSFKQDLLNGLHAFGTTVTRGSTTKDNFNFALFQTTGSLGAGTTSYTSVTASEVSSAGYSAGGSACPNTNAPTTTGTVAWWNASGNISWSGVSFTTDCALLYNNTLSGKNAVGVYTFLSQTATVGTFTLQMPASDSTHALIQVGP